MYQLLIAHRNSNLVTGLLFDSLEAARLARRAAGESKYDLLRFGPDSMGSECWIRREALASITLEPVRERPAKRDPDKSRIVVPSLELPPGGNGGAL